MIKRLSFPVLFSLLSFSISAGLSQCSYAQVLTSEHQISDPVDLIFIAYPIPQNLIQMAHSDAIEDEAAFDSETLDFQGGGVIDNSALIARNANCTAVNHIYSPSLENSSASTLSFIFGGRPDVISVKRFIPQATSRSFFQMDFAYPAGRLSIYCSKNLWDRTPFGPGDVERIMGRSALSFFSSRVLSVE